MNKKSKIKVHQFLLLLLLLTSPTFTQFPDLFGNTNGISPNTGNSTNNVGNSTSGAINTTLTSVISEDAADIPIIHQHYKDFCFAIINLVHPSSTSQATISTAKQDICERLVLNSGDNLKNKWLGDKMIGYVGTEVLGQNWDFNAGIANLLGIAGNLNTNLLNNLNNNKQNCWDKSDNCQLGQSLLDLQAVQSLWGATRNTGQVKVKEHIQALEQSSGGGSDLPDGFRRMRRMLRGRVGIIGGGSRDKLRDDGNDDKGKVVKNYASLDEQVNSKEGKKELLEKLNKFTPDLTKLSPVEKKAFKLKDDVRIVKDKINAVIRNWNTFSSAVQQQIIKGVEINLKYAKYRCEKKFGPNTCKQMNAVSYCYNCNQGEQVYWKTPQTCGCKTVAAASTTRKQVWRRERRRILKAVIKAENGGLSSNVDLNNQEKNQARLMRNSMDNLKINDAFFYEVEDYYRDHPVDDGGCKGGKGGK